MAASLSPAQRQEDFKEEFLACSICTEPYDNDQHQAKCLPCLHTYCKSCLKQHAGRRPKFNCPNCRSLVTLPGGSVDRLPSNFIVENLKDYHDIFNFTVSCGSCEDEENQAVSFCHDCGCFLCQICVDQHRRMGPLRVHKLSTMAELQDQRCNPMARRNQQCKKHPKQDLTLFCKEPNCKIPVCASCGHVDHRGHDLIDLAVAIEETVAGIQRSTAKIQNKNQEIVKKRDETEAKQKALTDNFNQKEKELLQSKQKLTNSIDSQYTKAQSHLKSLYQTEMNRLSSTTESLDTLAAQMTSACEFANQACDTSNRGQLLTSQNQIMNRLGELEIKALPSEPSSGKTGLNLTNQHHQSVTKIEESMQHLFDTDWERKQQTTAHKDASSFEPGGQRGSGGKPAKGDQSRQQRQSDESVSSFAAGDPRSSSVPQVDPSRCTIKLKQEGRRVFIATVQTVDTTGQLMTTGGAKVEASVDRMGSRPVTDNNDGTYTFTWWHSTGQVHVTINGIPMKGNPFTPFTP